MSDEHEADEPTADKALAALSTSLNSDVAHKLLDLVRQTSTMSVETALDADKKVAGLLGGYIDAQAKEIAKLQRRTVRLEKTVVALIGRRREARGGRNPP